MQKTTISKQSKKELLNAIRERYRRVSKGEKSHILDEFIQVSGYHANSDPIRP